MASSLCDDLFSVAIVIMLVCSCLHGRPIGFPLVITTIELLPNTKIVYIACFAHLFHCECPQLK